MEKKKVKFYERLASMERLDMSSLQSLLSRLLQEKEFLEGIFNSLKEGIIVIDNRLSIQLINEAAQKMFSLGADCEDQPIGRFFKQFDWRQLKQIPPREWGRFSRRELEIFYPEHRLLSFYLMPAPVRPDMRRAGLPLACLIFHDVTEDYEANEKQVETQKVKAITQLAAGVAHELGNPLNSLGIHLQVLQRKLAKIQISEDDKAIFNSHLDKISQELTRLDTIVRNFLSAVRPQDLQLSPIAIGPLLHEALEFMGQEIANHNIEVEISMPVSIPTLVGDSNQLTQAFYNIIKNAIQAMPDGGKLSIEAIVDDVFVHISFTDTGKGLTDTEISHILEPYYTTKSSGTGLGLIIVDRIVRAHGGELGIEGQAGRGARFIISLPLQQRRIRQLPQGDATSIETQQ
jgi:signal transduction histidine kinase